MTEKDFIPSPYLNTITEGKVGYSAPSNIALVKYWGKQKNQIPANPSISFTLNNCATTTFLSYKKLDKPASTFSFDLFFEGALKPEFRPKIETFFTRVLPYLPFLKEYRFTIETSNSFPHSSGIASSASGMAALALCLMRLEQQLNPNMTPAFYQQKASFLARLGSGSACRSIAGSLVQWGAHKDNEASSNLYGVAYPHPVHEVFTNYQDTILLVDKGEKQVSSTVGHDLMHGHPFASQRFSQAHHHLSELKTVLETGNLSQFMHLVELEALTLHAMMMTSTPYFMLMKPHTLEILHKIWAFREATKAHVCFTLDAGANVHVLYPEKEKTPVLAFIKDELVAYCQNQQYICDSVGVGAQKLPA